MKSKNVKIEDILPPEVTVRTLGDEEAFDQLVLSIREHGLIQPIVVTAEGDKYRLVSGHRRLLACKALGWEKIPAVIANYTEEEAAIIRIHENANREDVNPVDLARYMRWCMDQYGWTQQQLADHLNRSIAYVSQHLKLLTLDDETRRMVEIGELGARHGYHLAKIKDVETRQLWARHAAKYHMSVQHLEKAIAEYQEAQYRREHPEARPPVDYTTQPYDRPRARCFICDSTEDQAALVSRLVCYNCLDAIRMAAQKEGGGE